MKIVKLTIVFFILIIALVIYLVNQPPYKILTIKGNKLYCEISDNEELRKVGLMHRKSLGKDSGMVFIYQDEKPRLFHMANVKIPLSIAFADRHGIIVHMTEMKMDATTTYSSEKGAMYAVEANQGWFSSKKIAVGDKIEGLNSPALK